MHVDPAAASTELYMDPESRDEDAYWGDLATFEGRERLVPKNVGKSISAIEIEPEKKYLRWSELDAMTFPTDRWRVANLIPRAGSVILAAISGEGKTWVALELARSIAMGTNFLDDERFITLQGKVLYIDAENAKSELQRRGRQLGFVDSDNLTIWPVDELNLTKEDVAQNLVDDIIENRFDVVIIDTFRSVAGGLKEEKAEEVRALFSRFKALKERDVCIIWLDHFRKPSNFEGKIPKKEHLFGSQDKTASVEVLLMMQKEGEKISVYQRKNRLGKEIDAFCVEMTDTIAESGEILTLIRFAGEVDDRESKKEEAMELILEILKEESKVTPDIIQIVYAQKKIGQRNVREALRDLLVSKLIDRRKKGRTDEYFLVESLPEGDISYPQVELASLFEPS
ncbi:MAG: repair protein RadA [Parcubacteria group bacterium]|nr:repair protein RadA [Parcubacteria group bacterium]